MTQVRRLNELGLQRLGEFLDSLKTDTPQGYPAGLLADPAATGEIGLDIMVEPQTFGSRYEAAKYLDDRLTSSRLREVERDKGLWAWLALFYFDELCPPAAGNRRKP